MLPINGWTLTLFILVCVYLWMWSFCAGYILSKKYAPINRKHTRFMTNDVQFFAHLASWLFLIWFSLSAALYIANGGNV